MSQLSFFIGKGGVGKTTVSAAYAVHAAVQDSANRVLLISIDPAHSLSDILQTPLQDKPKRIPLPRKNAGTLYVREANATNIFRDFLAEHRETILEIIDQGSIFSRQDIEPFIDATLPGMAEVSGLLAIQEAISSRKYSHIVVDTAPFGHTLRLLELPQMFLRFLSFLELAASRDTVLAAHFGGAGKNKANYFVEDWRPKIKRLQIAIAKEARLFLVTSPETFSLNESVRCGEILKQYSPPMTFHSIVLNRAVIDGEGCKICGKRAANTRQALKFLRKHFRGLKTYIGVDPGGPILGVANLKWFGSHVFEGKELKLAIPTPKVRPLRLRRIRWPDLAPLSFVLGKGGVGKTTISAALGFNARKKRKNSVHVCSVDPAPSLDDIFKQAIGNTPVPVLGDTKFLASEMDSVALFKEWLTNIRAEIERSTGVEVSGVHLDLTFERRLLSELLEIVPPGIDEVFAVFRILDLLEDRSRQVVIDMAPTGHALDLLRTPNRILGWTRPLLKTLATHRTLAVAREAAFDIASIGQQVRKLSAVLTSGLDAGIHIVLLPELLPDRETERLISELHDLDLAPKSMFINRVTFPKDAENCERCIRAMRWQQKTIWSLKRQYSGKMIYVVRNFFQEIAGKSSLAEFTGQLWQLV